ncbi:MAG: hypothetical protein ACK5JT_02705 [Hyphomicrobiaceae bacterium]
MIAIPPDLKDALLLAVANPAAIAAGYYLGRKADQVQKLVLAPFVAGIAGMAFAWLLMRTGVIEPKIRLLVGIFIASGVLGIGWSVLGYLVQTWKSRI